MDGLGEAIGKAITGMIIIALIVGVLVGGCSMLACPKLTNYRIVKVEQPNATK